MDVGVDIGPSKNDYTQSWRKKKILWVTIFGEWQAAGKKSEQEWVENRESKRRNDGGGKRRIGREKSEGWTW